MPGVGEIIDTFTSEITLAWKAQRLLYAQSIWNQGTNSP
jgi:hypothetical protein